ncbi:MAG: HlyD family efflux transporter periplasmic adaptor subunit [Candidatus Pacebacteria bacterium]|nr:HlyD family efflux transporter periplasmic adaptor subunit [Candidatus Paceibacterota bacterium]
MNNLIHTIRARALEHATEHAMVYVGIVLAASASVYAGTLHTGSENVSTISPRVAPIVETVSLQGLFSPSSPHEIVSQREGTISYIAIKQGDVVASGDVLVAYDMTDTYVERASLERDLETYEQAYQALLAQRIQRDVDVQILQTESRLRRIQKELVRVDEEIFRGQVRAPFGGTVQKVLVDRGDSVSPQDVLVVMQPTSTYEVVAAIEDAKKISIGDAANITLASGKALPVTVIKKETATPDAFITVVPQEDVSNSKQGDAVRVEVLVATREHALTIPREYISMLNDTYGEVRIKHGDTYVVRLVEIGVVGDDGQVEVVSGLRKDDVVVK